MWRPPKAELDSNASVQEVSLDSILARINELEADNKRLESIVKLSDSNAVRQFDQSQIDNKTPAYKVGIYRDIVWEGDETNEKHYVITRIGNMTVNQVKWPHNTEAKQIITVDLVSMDDDEVRKDTKIDYGKLFGNIKSSEFVVPIRTDMSQKFNGRPTKYYTFNIGGKEFDVNEWALNLNPS